MAVCGGGLWHYWAWQYRRKKLVLSRLDEFELCGRLTRTILYYCWQQMCNLQVFTFRIAKHVSSTVYDLKIENENMKMSGGLRFLSISRACTVSANEVIFCIHLHSAQKNYTPLRKVPDSRGVSLSLATAKKSDSGEFFWAE